MLRTRDSHPGGDTYEGIKKAYEESLRTSLNNLEAGAQALSGWAAGTTGPPGAETLQRELADATAEHNKQKNANGDLADHQITNIEIKPTNKNTQVLVKSINIQALAEEMAAAAEPLDTDPGDDQLDTQQRLESVQK